VVRSGKRKRHQTSQTCLLQRFLHGIVEEITAECAREKGSPTGEVAAAAALHLPDENGGEVPLEESAAGWSIRRGCTSRVK
jgi:hypothetical protein